MLWALTMTFDRPFNVLKTWLMMSNCKINYNRILNKSFTINKDKTNLGFSFSFLIAMGIISLTGGWAAILAFLNGALALAATFPRPRRGASSSDSSSSSSSSSSSLSSSAYLIDWTARPLALDGVTAAFFFGDFLATVFFAGFFFGDFLAGDFLGLLAS